MKNYLEEDLLHTFIKNHIIRIVEEGTSPEKISGAQRFLAECGLSEEMVNGCALFKIELGYGFVLAQNTHNQHGLTVPPHEIVVCLEDEGQFNIVGKIFYGDMEDDTAKILSSHKNAADLITGLTKLLEPAAFAEAECNSLAQIIFNNLFGGTILSRYYYKQLLPSCPWMSILRREAEEIFSENDAVDDEDLPEDIMAYLLTQIKSLPRDIKNG